MNQAATIIIPTYNERRNITGIVAHILEAMADHEAEILIIDDDSQDLTWQVARNAFRDSELVTVIRRTEESGLATAVTRGFREASTEYCVVMDADFQHPPAKIPELIAALEAGADIAIGSRYTEGGSIENWSTFRMFVSRIAVTLSRMCVPSARGISDPVSGFFAVRRSVVTDVALDPSGYKILLEILTRGEHDAVTEVPFVFTEREHGESNIGFTVYQQFLQHIISLRLNSQQSNTERSISDTDADSSVETPNSFPQMENK